MVSIFLIAHSGSYEYRTVDCLGFIKREREIVHYWPSYIVLCYSCIFAVLLREKMRREYKFERDFYRWMSSLVVNMHECSFNVGQDFYLVLKLLADIVSFP
jgi:hypothetical protein